MQNTKKTKKFAKKEGVIPNLNCQKWDSSRAFSDYLKPEIRGIKCVINMTTIKQSDKAKACAFCNYNAGILVIAIASLHS